jgi:hypothetical protein
MAWSVMGAFLVGLVFALRLPILHFTIAMIVVVIAYALTALSVGHVTSAVLKSSLIYGAVLEFGYVFAHLILYFAYLKMSGRQRNIPAPDMQSKFSHDQ